MFYDINVMNSRTLGATWRLANQVSGDTSNVGLKKICSSLNKCFERRRVSLRTSSVLVNGAARVYKEEAEQLYRDCIKLNKDMIRRSNRHTIKIVSISTSPEEDSRIKRRNSNSDCRHSNRKRNNPYSIQRSPNERSGTNGSENDICYRNNSLASESSSNTTKEIGVQTTKSFISNRKKYFQNNPNTDETQPFGLVMVCDPKSRIPKKIIYSKVNVQEL